MRTIAHVYDSYTEASRVVSQLEAAGVPSDNISLISGDKGAGGSGGTATGVTSGDAEQGAATGAGTGATLGTVLGGGAGLLAGLGSLAIPGVGPIVAAGWLVATLTGAGVGAAAGGLAGSLIGAGVSEADAQSYSEGVSRGGTLVTVRADEGMASRIQQIMGLGGTASTGPSVTDTVTTHVTSPGMTTAGLGTTASASTTAATTAGTTLGTTTAATTGTTGTDDTIKVVREDLVVGKREVERGGVRVTSHVVETPVEEQVRLHDERVTIERRPVDQPVGNLPADAFQERVIEATAMSEEAVVAKDVRVVEEIAIRKEATERVETVRDTVRETRVDIEDTTATGTTAGATTGATTTTTGTTGMGTTGTSTTGTGTTGTGTASTTDTAATTGRSNTGTTRDVTGGSSVSGALPRD